VRVRPFQLVSMRVLEKLVVSLVPVGDRHNIRVVNVAEHKYVFSVAGLPNLVLSMRSRPKENNAKRIGDNGLPWGIPQLSDDKSD
jgi:hypothetical protein